VDTVNRFLEKSAGLAPHQLSQTFLNGLFLDWKKRYARNTMHVRWLMLKRMLRSLEAHGVPPLEFAKVPGPRAREATATPAQLAALRHSAPPWLRLFILLCWQTALRFSEALAVTPRSYNADTSTVTIRTKGDKTRTIPLTEEIRDLLKPTLDGDRDTSCIALLKGTRCSPGAIRSAWCQLTKRLGIEGVNPHDLRRTTATALYRTTHDLRAVQQYLGHDAMTSTLRYLAPLKEEELREYHKLLSFHSEVKQ
jgi:integrase